MISSYMYVVIKFSFSFWKKSYGKFPDIPAVLSRQYRQYQYSLDFGALSSRAVRVPEHVTTRKTQRRIHAGMVRVPDVFLVCS